MIHMSPNSKMRRRDVLCAGGAAVFSALTASLLKDAKPALAEPLSGPVPEVDRLSVRVVVDAYQIAVAPSVKKDDVEIQRFGWGLSDKTPSGTLQSEFGLSMHVEAGRGDQTRNVLVDFGFTPEALVNNLELLRIDPARLDALVLSHGHYDHFGGLVGFLRRYNSRLKPKLPFYVGGEECFCSRQWTAPPQPGNFGVLDRKALQNSNLAVTVADRPAVIADLGFSTGPIDLTSFEQPKPPTVMKIGMDNGSGCNPASFSEEERKLGAFPDKFQHEIATSFNLKGRGLVVLSSCSHRGVINAVQRAQMVSGVRKVHAVIGGFHLAPYPDDYVRQTVAAFQSMGVDYVIPLHCAGENFYSVATSQMPAKLLRSYTGTRLVFAS
jgi:7,8-dihydropterin-6-yl-methyl-4-(beta-D-ribofuranosyl)aminobenzene 5'-phosphate synthase